MITTAPPIPLSTLTSASRICPETCCSGPGWPQSFEHRGRCSLTNRYRIFDETILLSDVRDDVR
jgi:hypothetical protein